MDENEGLKKGAWTRILILILPYFIVVGLFQIVGGLLVRADFTNVEAVQTSFQDLVVSFFGLVGTLLLLWFFMKKLDNEPFVNLGFQTKNRLKDFVIGIAVGLIIMSLGFIILIYLKEIFFVKVNFDAKELVISVLIFTIVSVVEETLFRGYVLRNLMYSMNKYVALILSSVLFSLMHGFNPNIDAFALFNLFLAGILLGMSYLYTKNLWFPIGLHLSWNLFQVLFGFSVSGMKKYSLVEIKILEPNLINGGAFGFEGSYLSIIAQIITIACIVLYYEKNKGKETVLI